MIEVRDLRKCFGQTVAVDDISFTVDRGEVLEGTISSMPPYPHARKSVIFPKMHRPILR